MDVLRLHDVDESELAALLARFQLGLKRVPVSAAIPGSYWGDSEAGLGASDLYAREDTPVHSVLHETGHFVCMTPEPRKRLFRDAGGGDAEENAVCYLQVLLSEQLPCISKARLFRDMDTWGYSWHASTRAVLVARDHRAGNGDGYRHHHGRLHDGGRSRWR